MFTRKFWKDAAERAISTGAQVSIAGWGVGTLPDVSVPLWSLASMALAGAGLSLIKALAASKVGDSESASLVTK
jgi:hypothetical protein